MRSRPICALLVLLALFPLRPFAALADVSFQDACGHTLSFASTPSRVVSLYGSFAEAWLLAGGELVGVTQDALTERGLSLGEQVQIVGTVKEPNLEAVIALDPDFVVLSADIASHAPAAELLRQMGIPCALFRVDTFDDYLEMFAVFCELTGREDCYAQYGEAVAAQIDAVRAAVQGMPARRVLLLRAYSSGVKAKRADNLAGAILQDLGCDNIADRNEHLLEELSLEAIVSEDPEFIFVTVMGSDEDAALAFLDERFGADPAWQGLTAVREGRLLLLPKELFHYKPNARWGESYAYLAEILFPECL